MRREMRIDLVSLTSGAVISALGGLVLIDSSGVLDLSLGWIAVALTGAVGTILFVGGLASGRAGRHD